MIKVDDIRKKNTSTIKKKGSNKQNLRKSAAISSRTNISGKVSKNSKREMKVKVYTYILKGMIFVIIGLSITSLRVLTKNVDMFARNKKPNDEITAQALNKEENKEENRAKESSLKKDELKNEVNSNGEAREEPKKNEAEAVAEETKKSEEDKVIETVAETSEAPKGKSLDVRLISQNPELYNGCEVTCLAMLLNYKGVKVDKLTLAKQMKKNPTKAVYNSSGEVIKWGNPKYGFVGDVYGESGIGYSIDPEPLMPLISKYQENPNNLTGKSLDDIKESINNENPVLVWVESNFSYPIEFIQWNDEKGGVVKATFDIHAILITGYDGENIYYNDPLTGEKNKAISQNRFTQVWKAMGSKALSVN